MDEFGNAISISVKWFGAVQADGIALEFSRKLPLLASRIGAAEFLAEASSLFSIGDEDGN